MSEKDLYVELILHKIDKMDKVYRSKASDKLKHAVLFRGSDSRIVSRYLDVLGIDIKDYGYYSIDTTYEEENRIYIEALRRLRADLMALGNVDE